MSLQQTFYGVAQPIVNQTNAGVSSLSGSISGSSSSGAGPNIAVSTLTVNDSGNITLDWNNGGGTLNFGFEATNTSSFILQQGIGVSGTKVAGPDGCLQVLEKDGGTNQVFAPLQASGFEVCATAYPGGAFAGLYFSTIGSVLYSAVGQPLTIDAPSGVFTSSLTVSSINGSTFPPTLPNMNWGAVNIPASGSTIASVADSPYSGAYYQQLTYRGNIQGSISTLFASTINGNSFYIYGEPGQQVQYFTIGF